MELGKIERKYGRFTVAATRVDGTAATLTAVDVALLPPRTTPTAATTWTPATYTAGAATVLLAGPDADATGAIVAPAGDSDLWAKVADSPEVDTALIGRVTVS